MQLQHNAAHRQIILSHRDNHYIILFTAKAIKLIQKEIAYPSIVELHSLCHLILI